MSTPAACDVIHAQGLNLDLHDDEVDSASGKLSPSQLESKDEL